MTDRPGLDPARTALLVMDRDYQIVVLDDATADPDPARHAFLTATIFPRHAIVMDVDDLPELWA